MSGIDTADIQAAISSAMRFGPRRVVIDASGHSVNPEVARKAHQIKSSVVYVRDDGWTLGAPEQFAEVARLMWEETWVAVVRISGGQIQIDPYPDFVEVVRKIRGES